VLHTGAVIGHARLPRTRALAHAGHGRDHMIRGTPIRVMLIRLGTMYTVERRSAS
jgi:hypothetical protein